tara:strand:+ start:340 stop:747 length:408 start_codon:yes stop_codon:yes gene_type:complete
MSRFVPLLLFASIASCTPLDLATKALGSLGGSSNSGTAVDVNAQIGAENEQSVTVGTRTDAGDVKLGDNTGSVKVSQGETNKVQSETIGSVTVNETNATLIILLVAFGVIGWMLPTPSQIFRGFIGLFKRTKKTV